MAHSNFEGIGFSRLLILYQLDGCYESPLPDVAHMGQLPEWVKQSRHRLALRLQSSERLLFLEHLEICQRYGAAERITGIAVPVQERFEVFVLAENGLLSFVGGASCGE